jgi:hypothetical protein
MRPERARRARRPVGWSWFGAAALAAATLASGCRSDYERVEIVGVLSRCDAPPPTPGTTLAAGGDPCIGGGLVAVDEQRCLRELGAMLPAPPPPPPADPLATVVKLLAQSEAALGAAAAEIHHDAGAGRLPAAWAARLQRRVARLATALAALAQARMVPPAAGAAGAGGAAGPAADPLVGEPLSRERRDPLWAPVQPPAAALATSLAALDHALAGTGADAARQELDTLGACVHEAVSAETASACADACAELAQRLAQLWSGPALGSAPLRAALLEAEQALAALRRRLDEGLARLAWPQPTPLVVAPPITGLPEAAAPIPGAAP